MNKIICGFFLLCLFAGSVFALQNAESLCAGTPLDCAVSLLKSENDLENREPELIGLATNYWDLEKKREAIQLIELLDEDDGKEKLLLLIDFAEKSLKKGNPAEAAELLTKTFEYREDFDDLDEYSLKKFAYILVTAGLEEKIGDFLDSLDSEYLKVVSLSEISKSFWQKGDYLKTIEMLAEAAKYAEQIDSEFRKNEARAEIGREYSEIGELKNGFELIDLAKNYVGKDSDVFEAVFAAYLKAGEYEKAIEIVNENPNFIKSEIAYRMAEVYFRAGNKAQSLKFLGQTANYEKEIAAHPTKGFEYRFLVDVVKLYLNWNEPVSALQVAKTFENVKAQQFSLIEISEYYRNEGNPEEAFKVVASAFERAQKIKQNDDKKGEMVRDDFLANLADECINANNFVLAEKIIRSIEKKYYRGGGLAALVLKNRNYLPKKIFALLDEAQILFQKNNSNHSPFDKIRLWSILAHGYSENGKKAQAQAVFAEIFSYIANDKTVNDSGVIEHLATAGSWFEKCELTADENIRKSLNKIAVRWLADNPPNEN